MKKWITIVLSVVMVVSITILADAAVPFAVKCERGEGKYAVDSVEKKTSTGKKASFNVTLKSNSAASMYYQVRKLDGVGASEEVISKGTGAMSAKYWLDGNGNTLGRYGESYKFRVAHRSQSTYSGRVTIVGSVTP